MKNLIIINLILLSSAFAFANSANLPGPQTSTTSKESISGVEFESSAARPSPLVIEIINHQETHSDGDFYASDREGRKRFKLQIGSSRTTLKYYNSAGTAMIEQEVSFELRRKLITHFSSAMKSCPLLVSINRSQMRITDIEATCDIYQQ